MAEYNGHRSKASWNVALWIGNDYALYTLARELRVRHKSNAKAAIALMRFLPPRTPDGFRYTLTSVREAVAGLEVTS